MVEASAEGDSVLVGSARQADEGGQEAFFGGSRPLQAARDAFNEYDADRRRRAVAILASASFGGEAVYVRLYRMLLEDPDTTVRAAAIHALGLHGGPEDGRAILGLLEDPAAFVRWEAAKTLQRIHVPAAEPPLVRLLASDEDADVRMAVAAALGQFPSRYVFDALILALSDVNYGVVHAAAHSLEILTGQRWGLDPRDWLQWSQQEADLFENRQTYTFQPYTPPPSMWRRLNPLASPDGLAEPREPAGI